MKLALISPTPVPASFGGMDRLLDGLLEALRSRHPTDLITIPFDERTREGVLKGYHDFYNLDLSAYDRVISYKAPGYMANHPNHVVYLSHRLRVFYDLWEEADAEHQQMRELIQYMDNWALAQDRIPYIFTVGETVTRRLRKFGDIESTAVHHPTTLDPHPPRRGEYFLHVGRLHPWKRIDLVIKAYKLSKATAPLKICGEGPHEEELRKLAGDDSRIEFLGKITDEELRELYSGAIATVFPPISEDMGLITFESFLSGKPLLTVSDSGEPALIVEEGKTGFVTEPTPKAMAERFDWMDAHPDEMEAMGEACLEWMRPVTWDRLVDRLLEAGDDIETRRESEPIEPPAQARATTVVTTARRSAEEEIDPAKINLLVTDNQIIDPPVGGGRVRILELYRHMPDDFATTYIGAFDYPGPEFRDQYISPNFREILTPLTAPHFKKHNLLATLTGGKATIDVTMPLLGGNTPRYRRLIDRYLPHCDLLVCAHPWMYPFLPQDSGKPLIYDSQNCEGKLKPPLLKGSLVGNWLGRKVIEAERDCIAQSELVMACSPDDKDAFQEMYGTPLDKIIDAPNGVDCAQIQPATPTEKAEARQRLDLAPKAPVCIFTGSNYEPNLEGAAIVIEQVAPEFPEATFLIPGGVGPMYQERYPSQGVPKNVRLLGFVDRDVLLDLYKAADVAMNPMLQGSGTAIKMLDYMAAGLAIIATPIGARGLLGEHETHWMSVEASEVAVTFKELIDNPKLRTELGRNARALAEERFDWCSIAGSIAERFRELADRTGTGSKGAGKSAEVASCAS